MFGLREIFQKCTRKPFGDHSKALCTCCVRKSPFPNEMRQKKTRRIGEHSFASVELIKFLIISKKWVTILDSFIQIYMRISANVDCFRKIRVFVNMPINLRRNRFDLRIGLYIFNKNIWQNDDFLLYSYLRNKLTLR